MNQHNSFRAGYDSCLNGDPYEPESVPEIFQISWAAGYTQAEIDEAEGAHFKDNSDKT
jgi:hypothetical protein